VAGAVLRVDLLYTGSDETALLAEPYERRRAVLDEVLAAAAVSTWFKAGVEATRGAACAEHNRTAGERPTGQWAVRACGGDGLTGRDTQDGRSRTCRLRTALLVQLPGMFPTRVLRSLNSKQVPAPLGCSSAGTAG
jgi:hypothetical protein